MLWGILSNIRVRIVNLLFSRYTTTSFVKFGQLAPFHNDTFPVMLVTNKKSQLETAAHSVMFSCGKIAVAMFFLFSSVSF